MGLDASLAVTASVFGLCIALYYGFLPLPMWIQTFQDVCLLPSAMISATTPAAFIQRAILPHVFHLHDLHLYYNMTSWLWKGRQLERRFGSIPFLVLVVLLALVSSCLHVAFAHILARMGHTQYMQQCAVGLSSVLFALKVVLFHDSSSSSTVMGLFPVPSKYVYWVELAVIQIIDPTSSWIGHAAGIVAGLLFVKGPLRRAMRTFVTGIQAIVELIHIHSMRDENDEAGVGGGEMQWRDRGTMTNAERDRVRQAHLTRTNNTDARRRT